MSAESTIADILKPITKAASSLKKLELQAAKLDARIPELSQQIAESLTAGRDVAELSEERRACAQSFEDVQNAIRFAEATLNSTITSATNDAAERRMLQVRRLAGSQDEARRNLLAAVEEAEQQLAHAQARVAEKDHELAVLHAEALVLNARFNQPLPGEIGRRQVRGKGPAKLTSDHPLPSHNEKLPRRLGFSGQDYSEVRRVINMVQDTPTAALLEHAGWPETKDKQGWLEAQQSHMIRSRQREAERKTAHHEAVTEWLRNLLSDGPVSVRHVHEQATDYSRRELNDAAGWIGVVVVHPVVETRSSQAGNPIVHMIDDSIELWALRDGYDTDSYRRAPSRKVPQAQKALMGLRA